jgi:hypothetical protein
MMTISSTRELPLFSILLASSVVLLLVLVSSVLFYPHDQYHIRIAWASSSNATLYFDCGSMPNKVIVEALPVDVDAEYTMWLYDTNIKLGNSTTTQTTGESIMLGNGEGFFKAILPVASKLKDMYLAVLYAGYNTNSSALAKGAGTCNSSSSSTADTGANTQNIEQQCLAAVDKQKEVKGVKLTAENCKPMTIKNIE